ncbi:DNA-binding protein [Vibrio atlanticus]|uniref:Chromosome partition protein Smc n=1 Tax=Vibrio atlanticus TaxID=693153 RepID=A0A1C3IMS2_9VIBR|nr:DNA-binding protein [Vibrio atlanticus]SBS62710.1 Chromosome partition protein Smc [Vibrio atlanticus]
MARPKSYTDEDIIDIATQLCSKGRKPTGWYIKEILGRGKIASIQADLDRLTKSGKVPEIPEPNNDKDDLGGQPLRASFELPIEIQEMLSIREQEVCKSLRNMTIGLNNKAQLHYEALMDARVRELDIKSDAAIKAKEIAEEDGLDLEARLQKQVEHNELLEEQIEILEVELAQSKQEISELVQNNGQLTLSLSKAAENIEAQQNTITGLTAKLSTMETTHASIMTRFDCATNELEALRIHHSALSEQHEEAKERLIETSTQLQSTQDLLNKYDNQLDTLRNEKSELSVNHRLLEKNLSDSEGKVALLTQENQRLEAQLAAPVDRAAPLHTE